jgi:hypothetical protein
MRPDQKSGQAISNLPDPHAESCRYSASGKKANYPILRPEAQNSPRTASSGETLSKKSQKQLLLATQNCLVGEPVIL